MTEPPRLTVVVTIVDGGPALERCLAALDRQTAPPAMEIVVPWDDSLPEPTDLVRRFAQFRFLPMGPVVTERDPRSPAGQHELFDRRRAAGLRVARGDFIAILEDRGVPRPDWAGSMIRLHALYQAAAIGGAIENGRSALLNWAVYFCDFSRYQLPFDPGQRPWVSDVNICYRREALEETRELWADRYHETTVHWELQRRQRRLLLCPDAVVDQQRGELHLGALLIERRDWGRLFAYTRARELPGSSRAMLAIGTVALPFVLVARQLSARLRKRRTIAEFVGALPAIALLLVAWAYGELLGYLTGRP